jgi:hypothetical protein
MTEVKTVTQEELQELKGLRNKSDEFIIHLGEIHYQKTILDAQENQLKEGIIALKLEEKSVTDKLVAKYGNVSIDIETGTIN